MEPTTEFEYDHNSAELNRQLEEVMDTHQSEKEAKALTELGEGDGKPTIAEPPVLDRLAMTTTGEQIEVVKETAKKASAVLREEIVRDRLREYQGRSLAMVDDFLKTAKADG